MLRVQETAIELDRKRKSDIQSFSFVYSGPTFNSELMKKGIDMGFTGVFRNGDPGDKYCVIQMHWNHRKDWASLRAFEAEYNALAGAGNGIRMRQLAGFDEIMPSGFHCGNPVERHWMADMFNRPAEGFHTWTNKRSDF